MYQLKTYTKWILALSLFKSVSGFAALGDTVDKVKGDQVKIRASSLIVRQSSRFSVHEMETPLVE